MCCQFDAGMENMSDNLQLSPRRVVYVPVGNRAGMIFSCIYLCQIFECNITFRSSHLVSTNICDVYIRKCAAASPLRARTALNRGHCCRDVLMQSHVCQSSHLCVITCGNHLICKQHDCSDIKLNEQHVHLLTHTCVCCLLLAVVLCCMCVIQHYLLLIYLTHSFTHHDRRCCSD